MKIFPAIDLLGGQAVRLLRGDYRNVTVYNSDPVALARSFADAGCAYLHLVDLDGAKSGQTVNLSTISAIVRTTPLFVEVGGGIRTLQSAQQYIAAGVSRIILGTAAVTDEGFLTAALARFPGKVAVGVDVKDGQVAIRGWTEQTDLRCVAFCQKMESLGVRHVICTDISRDGAMQGVNEALYRELLLQTGLSVTASGGVSCAEDIRRLRELGLPAAILGKAFYEGALTLSDALEAAK